jgi:hypothetical protein
MKMKQKIIAGAVALSAFAGFVVPAAHAEVAASVAVANMYYWRGLDLGKGDPALIGDVAVKANGFYAGLWASSGDAGLGTEYDFYAGYGFSTGPLSFDFNYTTYMYPTVPDSDPDDELPAENLGFDDVSDVALTVGLKPSDDVTLTLMHRVGVGEILADDDYTYTTFTAAFGKFSALVGTHSDDSGAYDGLTHLDLSYAYTSNLAFTLGKVIDQGDADWNDELKFVVKLSLPLGE